MADNLHLLPPILDYSYPSAQETDANYSFTFSLSVVGTVDFSYVYFRATDITSNALSGLLNNNKWIRISQGNSNSTDIHWIRNDRYVTINFVKPLNTIFNTNGETHNYKIQVCISNNSDITNETMPSNLSSDWSNSAIFHINNGIDTSIESPPTITFADNRGSGTKTDPYKTELNPEYWYGNYKTKEDNMDELVSFYSFSIYNETNINEVIEDSGELYLDQFSLPYYGYKFKTVLKNGVYLIRFHVETNYGYKRDEDIYVMIIQPWIPTRDTLTVSENDDLAYNIIDLNGKQIIFMVDGKTQLSSNYWLRDKNTATLTGEAQNVAYTHLRLSSDNSTIGTLDLYTPFQVAIGQQMTMILGVTHLKIFNSKYEAMNSDHYLFNFTNTDNNLSNVKKTIRAYLIKEGSESQKYKVYIIETSGVKQGEYTPIYQEYFIDINSNFTNEIDINATTTNQYASKELFLILKENPNGILNIEFATGNEQNYQWIYNIWEELDLNN